MNKFVQKTNSHGCNVSTGICGRLTFGYGKLDEFGYWEHGCDTCAKEWRKNHPNDAVWPIIEKEVPGLKFYV